MEAKIRPEDFDDFVDDFAWIFHKKEAFRRSHEIYFEAPYWEGKYERAYKERFRPSPTGLYQKRFRRVNLGYREALEYEAFYSLYQGKRHPAIGAICESTGLPTSVALLIWECAHEPYDKPIWV